jgi:hypothetical protein
MKGLPRNQILIGDALERLAELPDASVDTVTPARRTSRCATTATRTNLAWRKTSRAGSLICSSSADRFDEY